MVLTIALGVSRCSSSNSLQMSAPGFYLFFSESCVLTLRILNSILICLFLHRISSIPSDLFQMRSLSDRV